ncbi:hypothetical protein [Streptomyces palmae]|uniref:DUF7848 domain-containing protein n=1 Tax=Streptomyces palmae TaxID=1701085 RepID=A0A4Z0HG42_9ACTN|nr:hypothetical protein [Streptomyces palmae]TGB14958.1 hypothetical protein E4099_07570 [Streptomyces palmae]
MTTTRMRYVNMHLGPDPCIIQVHCTTCNAASTPAPEQFPGEQRNKAEEWALAHTGRADAEGRHHTGYRVEVTMFWRVTPCEDIDPPPGGLPS